MPQIHKLVMHDFNMPTDAKQACEGWSVYNSQGITFHTFYLLPNGCF